MSVVPHMPEHGHHNRMMESRRQAPQMDHRHIAHEFVERYYKLWQQSPDTLHKFYKPFSIFTFSRDSDGFQSTSTGQEMIRNSLMLAFESIWGQVSMVSKSQVDSQMSRLGGLLILVTGQFVAYDGYCQHFTHSFLLDRQELPTPGYFILNDFMRLVDNSHQPPCFPAGGVPVMPTEAMMCQDPGMHQQMGGMQMIPPHDNGQPQAWMQQRMHAPMLPQVHHNQLPMQQRPVHQMRPPGPGGEQASNGYPAAPSPNGSAFSSFANNKAVPRQTATGPAVPVDGAILEEPPRLPEQALVEQADPAAVSAATPEAYLTDAPKVGDGDEHGRDETQVEVELDVEDYDEDDNGLAQEVPQLEEMEARDDSEGPAAGQQGNANDEGAAASAEGPDGGNPDEVDDAQYARLIEEESQPKSWASMAGRLKQGGGKLVQSKVQGYGAPAGAAAATAAAAGATKPQPPTASSGSTGGPASRAPDRGTGAGERSSGAASTEARHGSSNIGSSQYDVWLWISRLPTDSRIEAQEVLDLISSHLSEMGARAVEIERREQSQEWANISVSSQEAAEVILHLSRERKLLLRGKSIKADVHQQRGGYASSRRGRTGGRGSAEGSSKGAGRGRGAGLEGGGDDERSSEGRGAGRARRKGGKGQGHSSDAKGGWSGPS